jgi:glycosyltransferase involved in cell wall biosynthesis
VSSQNRISVSHVVGVMDRGGVETWLMHILRRIDQTAFAFTFLTQTTQPGVFDEEIRDLGSKVMSCLYPSRPWSYGRTLRQILAGERCDIIHSHVHHYSGFVLRVARSSGVKGRIAHSHLDSSFTDAQASLSRTGYLKLMERWIARNSSCKLAASEQAGLSLFGKANSRNRWQIMPYGADLEPFAVPVDRVAVRKQLGLPEGAFVIGNVGRLAEQKNHAFLVQIAAELVARNPRAHLLLAGDGPLRPAIEQQAAAAGLSRHITFLGVRPDVPRLMLGAMDAFLFPSLYEGLGLALVEAQAAGLPCFYSDCIPKEADIVAPLVHRLSLAQPASEWTSKILQVEGRRPVEQAIALAQVRGSLFHIDGALRQLERVYLGAW